MATNETVPKSFQYDDDNPSEPQGEWHNDDVDVRAEPFESRDDTGDLQAQNAEGTTWPTVKGVGTVSGSLNVGKTWAKHKDTHNYDNRVSNKLVQHSEYHGDQNLFQGDVHFHYHVPGHARAFTEDQTLKLRQQAAGQTRDADKPRDHMRENILHQEEEKQPATRLHGNGTKREGELHRLLWPPLLVALFMCLISIVGRRTGGSILFGQKSVETSTQDIIYDVLSWEAKHSDNAQARAMTYEKQETLWRESNINNTSTGSTALHEASRHGRLELVETLINHGFDVDAKDSMGQTPLILASSEGFFQIVKFLLQHNASAGLANHHNETALFKACENGHGKVVHTLLRYDERVNALYNIGATPLYVASFYGHLDIVVDLIAHGAMVDFGSVHKTSPLGAASFSGHTEVVRFLLTKNADVNNRNKDGWSPLCEACYNGHKNVTEVLLNHGADVNVYNNVGYTPALVACKYGHEGVLQTLLEHNADPNARSQYQGWTAVHVASENGHVNILRLLVHRKADINARSFRSEYAVTALHLACRNGLNGTVKFLLEHGADVSSQDDRGWTPLHAAIEGGHVSVLRILLEHGADATAADIDGKTAADIAHASKQYRALTFLLGRSPQSARLKNVGWRRRAGIAKW